MLHGPISTYPQFLKSIHTLFDEIDDQDPPAEYVYLGVLLVPFWAKVMLLRVSS